MTESQSSTYQIRPFFQENNFLIVGGASKAGTTFLFDYLAKHPAISASEIKETRFFQDINYGQDLKDMSVYENHFKGSKNTEYFFEASPGYLYGAPNICEAIKQNIPQVKLIFVIRNPVKRFVSYYKHLINYLQIEKMSFKTFTDYAIEQSSNTNISKEAIEKDTIARSIRAGLYINYLPDWINIFGKENIQILFFEDLVSQPYKHLEQLCNWLDLDVTPYQNMNFESVNASFNYKNKTLHQASFWIKTRFRRFLPKSIKVYLNGLYRKLNKSSKTMDIDEASLKKLEKIYTQPNTDLKKYLNSIQKEPLPSWLS